MQATADTITRRLRDDGYPAARVFTSFETNKETRDRDGGVRCRAGAERRSSAASPSRAPTGSSRRLVRNLLVSRPGRLYSQDELFQSQRNLYCSDLFRYASVNIDSAKFDPGADSVPDAGAGERGRRRRVRGGLGYATDDCFRGSLGWTTRNFLGSGGRILDLTSRISKVGRGRAVRLGARPEHLQQLEPRTRSGRPRSTSTSAPRSGGRRSSRRTTRSRCRCSPSAARSSRCICAQETGTTVTLRRETPKRRIPLSLGLHPLLRAHRGDARELLRLVQRLHAGPGVAPPPEPRCSPPSRPPARVPQVNNPLDPSRGSLSSLELTLELARFLGSSSFEQFFRAVGGLLLVPPDRAGRGLQLAGARRRHLRPDRGRRHPDRQLHSARPAVLRRRPQRRPRLRAERAGTGGLRRLQGRGGQRRGGELPIDPDRSRSPRPAATRSRSETSSCGCRRRCSARGIRLAAFVDAGGVWDRGTGNPAVIRVTPGVGLRVVTPLGPGPPRRGLQSVQAPGGHALPVRHPGHPDAGAGTGSTCKDRGGKLTFHFAVGQAF